MSTFTQKIPDKNGKTHLHPAAFQQQQVDKKTPFFDNRPSTIAQLRLQKQMTDHTLKTKYSPLQVAAEGVAPETTVQKKEDATSLPHTLRSGIEQLSGYAMNDVTVHYNSPKPAQLQAHAYTQGTDIHVAPGQEKHLAHEAWHVVQQKQGRVSPTLQAKGVAINDDRHLEKEADVMGGKALRQQSDVSAKKGVNMSARPAMVHQLVVEYEQGTYVQVSRANGTVVYGQITKNLGNENYEFRVGGTDQIATAKQSELSLHPTMRQMTINKTRGSKMTDPDYEGMLLNFYQKSKKGRSLYKQLQARIKKGDQVQDVDSSGTFGNRYKTTSQGNASLSITANQAVSNSGGFYSVSTASKGIGEQNAAYANFVNPQTGTIIADSNYAEKDKDSDQTGGTKRLNNSEILIEQYKSVGGQLANLNYIIRSNIANTETQYVLTLIQKKLLDKTQERTWTPGDDEFYALLGTDNVKGTVFMLMQHYNQTGGKTIQRIVTKGIAYIRIELG